MFVKTRHHRIAFALRDRDGDDLIFEATLRDGGDGPPLALRREPVLGFARHAIAVGNLLGRAAHLIAAEGVGHQR